MKHRLLLFSCMTILLWSVKPIVAKGNLMVVPGRTWWYESAVPPHSHDILFPFIPINIGLTLINDPIDGWIPCYAIDAEGNFTIPQPLAHLKESNGEVWIRPNLKLYEISEGFDPDIHYILSFFLGYWDGNYIPGRLYEYSTQDFQYYQWNKNPVREEFLLYDFNSSVGFKYEWPWAGTNMIEENYTEETFEENGFFVEKVEEGEDARKIYEITQKLKTATYQSGKGKVVEGIGLIESDFAFYRWGEWTLTSFFISPASIQAPATSGFRDPIPPKLVNVREADGTCIYGDEAFQASISKMVSEPSPASNTVFDLLGREVSNPLPGSIYIRNGKKFVAK